MDYREFVWDHFKFNADQRLKSFNFFVLLSIFANGGVITALEKNLSPLLLAFLGAAIIIFTLVFWLVDLRNKNLIRLTIPALKEIESEFPETSRLFEIDARSQGRFVRYSFAFPTLMMAQLLVGFGVAVYGLAH